MPRFTLSALVVALALAAAPLAHADESAPEPRRPGPYFSVRFNPLALLIGIRDEILECPLRKRRRNSGLREFRFDARLPSRSILRFIFSLTIVGFHLRTLRAMHPAQ